MAKADSLLDRMLDSHGADLREALEALEWLVEMSGYAHEHLDADWRRRNGADHASAIGQAQTVLQKHGR